MKAVWTSGKKSKFNFRTSNLINLENGEILCFSSIDFLDDSKNLENIINSTTFKIAKNIKPPKVDVKYKKIYEECMEIYKIMDKYSI